MPEAVLARTETAAVCSPLESAWWCSGRYRFCIPSTAARLLCQLWAWCERISGRLFVSDTWLRYGMPLRDEQVQAILRRLSTKKLRVELLNEETLAEFAALAPTANQIVSARSLWANGLRRAYAARTADGRPLAFVWVLTSDDNARLATLPYWSGVYSPIPAGWLQLENALSLGRSLSRGQIMTDLTYSACARTDTGAAGILAHVGATNHLVRRWIESLGCRRHGRIVRMRIDLPLLRRLPCHIHTVEPPHRLGAIAASRQRAAARPAGAAALPTEDLPQQAGAAATTIAAGHPGGASR